MSCNSDIIKGNCAHSGGENEGKLCIGEVIFLIVSEESRKEEGGYNLEKERSGEKIQRDLFV